jgi:exodeoxyribonuclease-3
VKIATYNVNGVNGRLEVLLRWLEEASPDVVCLQELKAPDPKFPVKAIEAAGYGAIWHGQKSWNGVAILARNREPMLTRKGLPGDPDDTHSRYIEAAIDGMVIGCLYLPNGNPYPGPKFEYKLAWFDRLTAYAAELLHLEVPVILAGDYNVIPTELDVYKPERWVDDALFRVEVRDAYRRLLEQGWTDALRQLHPGERIYTFGTTSEMPSRGMPAFVSITSCSARMSPRGFRVPGSTSMSADGNTQATTRRLGSSFQMDLSDEGRTMTMNDWRADLRLGLEKLVDAAVVAGARQQDVYAAILEEIRHLRLAYERDPDPADDVSEQVIEEPSNNWPAADKS